MKQKKNACSSRKTKKARKINTGKMTRLALILGCTFGAASFALPAYAADYDINGTPRSTLADVLPVVTQGDNIFVLGDQSTASFSPVTADQKPLDFYLKSKDGAPVTISGDESIQIIKTRENLSINGDEMVSFIEGTTTQAGGAIMVLGSSSAKKEITISGVNFESNYSQNEGGALFSQYTSLISLDKINFKENVARYQGGAIHSSYTEEVRISNSTFDSNQSVTGAGGAINLSAEDTEVYLDNVLFDGNSGTRGGGIFINKESTTLDIKDSTFVNNETTTAASPEYGIGGGAILSHGTGSITGTNLFENNYAVNGGGALSLMDDWEIEGNTSFKDNTTDGEGGAIFFDTRNTSSAMLKISPNGEDEVTFEGNTASGESNSITFFGRNDSSYGGGYANTGNQLYIVPGPDAKVSLLDPVKVDMEFDPNSRLDDNYFDIVVAGEGEVVWGGKNEVSTTNGTTWVSLNNGKLTLNEDFSLVNTGTDSNMIVCIEGGEQGIQLNVLLDGRDTESALFQNVTRFEVDDDVELTLTTATPTFQTKEFLFTDGEEDISDKFVLSVTGAEAKLIYDEAEGKTILVYESAGPEKLLKNNDPNIASAADAMIEIYETNSHTVGTDTAVEIYNDILDNGQTYTAEGALSQAFGAFDQSNRVWQKVMQLNSCGEQFAAVPDSESTMRGQCGQSGQTCCAPSTRTWGGYLGTEASLDSEGYGGFSQSWNGIVGGISKDYQSGGNLGAYFSWAGGQNKLDQLNTKIENDAYNFGLFATVHPHDNVNFTLDVNYGHYTNDMYRNNATGFYSGSFNQNTYGTGIFLSKDYCRSNGIFTPYIGARYIYLEQGGYDETGTATAVDYSNSLNGFNASSLQSWLGASFSKGFQGPNCWIWTPTLFAAWRHEYMDNQFSTTGSYNAVPGQQFLLSSVSRERDMGDLGFSVSATANQISIGAGYNATLTNNYTDHNWFAGMSYRF